MRRRARISALLWLMFAATACLTAEPVASLQPTNYVNDFAGILDATTQAQLNNLCQQIDRQAHAQIAVVTVKTLDGQDRDTYAVALYQKFGLGSKVLGSVGKDKGVLILLATVDHQYKIQVGYGLESILPDGKVGGFGREAVPLLKAGNYSGAVTLLTTRVASVIAEDAGITLDNQPRMAPMRQRPAPRGGISPFAVIFIIIFVVIPILRALFGSGGGPRGGGGGGLGFLLGMLLSGGGGLGRGGGYGGGGGGFGGFGGGGGGGGFGGFGGGSTGGGGPVAVGNASSQIQMERRASSPVGPQSNRPKARARS